MRVIAFNGSPRKNGNTHLMIKQLFEALEKEGIQGEEIQVGGKLLHGCKACGGCAKKPGRCVQADDPMNEWIEKMKEADAIVLASPTYFANLTPEIKALMDRAGYVCRHDGKALRRKVGAPIAVARRGGAMHVYNSLMAFFGIAEMIVPMSSYWNMGYGLMPGDVEKDSEGMGTMKDLAENMAYVLKALKK